MFERARSNAILPKKPKLIEFGSARRLSTSKEEETDVAEAEKISRDKLLERRSNILNELFRTEATYVEYIQVAINLFLQPIKMATPGSKGYLPAEKIDHIFQNIEQLAEINANLLKKMALRKTQSKCAFGPDEVWLDLLTEAFSHPDLREGYQRYMHGYNHAMSTLEKMTKRGGKNTSFGNWLQGHLTKNNDLCRGLGNLPAFLICPVQRLPRYLLILRDLQKCTPEDHPDYKNLQESFKLIQEIVGAIDKEKTRYDEIYHLQGLCERFSVQDRSNVQELMDPTSILVTEGPILFLDPVSNSFKLRYLILLSHMVICCKKKKEVLQFAWKVDLYSCIIKYEPHGDGADDSPFITITEQTKEITEHSLTSEVARTLYTFSEEGCEYDFEFWESKLLETQAALLDVGHIASSANNIVNELQPLLMLKRDWDLLAVGASIENLSKGQKMIDIDTTLAHLYYINSGRCSVESGDHVITVLSDGDFYGECTYLDLESTEANAVVIVESDTFTVTKISYDRLTSILSGNNDLARRFFHVVTLVAASSYLRTAARTLGTGTEDNYEEEKRELIKEEKATSTPTPEKKNKKMHPALVKLKLDEIAPDEEVLQEYSCKLKKTKFSGQFFVLKEYVGFYSQVLGKKTRLVVPGRSITEVVARDDYCIYINNLKHNVGPFELQFKSQEKKQEAYTILASFLSDKKRSLAAKTGLSYTATGGRRGSSFFTVTDKLWSTLLSEASETFVLTKGDVVLPQGFMNDLFYQVLEGKIEAKVTEPETKELHLLDIICPGEVFGEIPFLLGLASNITLEAVEDSLVVAIPRPKIEKLIEERAEWSVSFYKFIARTLFTRLHKLQFCDQPEKLSDDKNMVAAPILDPNLFLLNRTPFAGSKSPILLRKRIKPIDTAARSSLPSTVRAVTDPDGTSSSAPKLLNRTPSLDNLGDLQEGKRKKSPRGSITGNKSPRSKSPRRKSGNKSPRSKSPRRKIEASWVSVNKRTSPTAPRRQLMSHRVNTKENMNDTKGSSLDN